MYLWGLSDDSSNEPLLTSIFISESTGPTDRKQITFNQIRIRFELNNTAPVLNNDEYYVVKV